MSDRHHLDEHQKIKELLRSVFTLCSLDQSLSTTMLDDLIRNARARAQRDAKKLGSKRHKSVDHDLIGHIVYHWQRSPDYLDEYGEPFPIPARGPAPSVEALFKKLGVLKQFPSALVHFKKLRRVRVTKNGRYVPKSEATIIPTLTPEVVESLTQTINCLVATVLHNTSARQTISDRLIERVAYVPDLPIGSVSEFKQFAREQAGGLIETVNDWLENSRGRAPRNPDAPNRIFAGLHVFAFLNKQRR